MTAPMTPGPESPRPVTDSEREKMQRRITLLESRCGALMVDADRRVEAAYKTAEDCAEHGKEIRNLRHISSYYWAVERHADQARQAIVTEPILLRRQLGGRTDTIPVDKLREWIEQALKAYDRSFRKEIGYPTPADCIRAGGCRHDDVSPELRAELDAETAPEQGDLFSEVTNATSLRSPTGRSGLPKRAARVGSTPTGGTP